MSGFVLIMVILFGLNFLSLPCQGQVSLPPEGDTIVVETGKNVKIKWSYRNVGRVIARVWTFESSDGELAETLAIIVRDGQPVIEKSISLPGVGIEKPATLVLKNVDLRYNGTYTFQLLASLGGVSKVTLFIVGRDFPVPGDHTLVASQGDDVKIHWIFNDPASSVGYRMWSFKSGDGSVSERLARVIDDDPPKIENSSLPAFKIEKPATLILYNIDHRYNGTYNFGVTVDIAQTSRVTLFIAGREYPVPGDYTLIAFQGDDVKINWTFNGPIARVFYRAWSFTSGDGRLEERLARIFDDDPPKMENSSLPAFKIEKPATLILNNVDLRYNGTYTFSVAVNTPQISQLALFIAGTPNVIVCSSPLTVNEGENATCLCTGDANAPKYPTVMWLNGNKPIANVGSGSALLTIINVGKEDMGTYTCEVEIFGLRRTKTIQLIVSINFAPNDTKVTFTPEQPKRGENVTINCQSNGLPSPSYVIIFDGSIISTDKPYTTLANDSVGGLYTCNTANKLGNDSATRNLTISVAAPTPTGATTSSTNMGPSNGTVATEWYIYIGMLLLGIIFGVFLSHMVVYCRRRFRNRKSPQTEPGDPQAQHNTSIYQDLDLTKMKSEDNYQSLRGNYARNDATPEHDPTYTELSKRRDDENNYQTLS